MHVRFNHVKIIHKGLPMFRWILMIALITAAGFTWLFVLQPLQIAPSPQLLGKEFPRTDLKHQNYAFYERNCSLRATISTFDGTQDADKILLDNVRRINVAVDFYAYNDKKIPPYLSAQTIGNMALKAIEERYLPILTPITDGCPHPDVKIHFADTPGERQNLARRLEQKDNITIQLTLRKYSSGQARTLVLSKQYVRKGYSPSKRKSYTDKNTINIPFDTPEEEARKKIKRFLEQGLFGLYWSGIVID